MILLIVAVGYMVTRAGMLSPKAREELTNLVIYIILPCNIFSSFHKGISPEMLKQCAIVLLVSLGMQLLYIALNKVLYNRFEPERRVVLQYSTICNNASFMGLPVIEAVFGQTGLLYGSIVLIPMRVFMWTAGLSLFTDTEVKQRVKTLATHPCIWAVIFGFAYIFAPFEMPVFLANTIKTIGGCTTALSMLIVGSILHGVDLKNVLDKDCLYYSFFRLIAIPALIYGVLVLLRADQLVTGVSVLSAAMPAAVTSAMLAEKYGQDSLFASKTIFVSTALSMITLPIASALLALL